MKLLISFLSLIFILTVSCNHEIKIACVGDSITNGGGTKVLSKSAYPVQLNSILGEKYRVLNCGEGGATMLKDGDKPYWNQKDFSNLFVFQPEIIVVMLGTNDSKTQNWNAESFEHDYQTMIDTFRSIKTNPEILLCSPPPAYNSAWNISDSTIRAGVIPIVQRLAQKNSLEIVNVYNNMSDMSNNFPDGIHPNEKGASILAGIIAEGIRN